MLSFSPDSAHGAREKGATVKKREKRLELSKETLRHLMAPLEAQALVAAVGGSCTNTGGSTAGGTVKVCCGPPM
jgi:hypothetical protein